MITTWDALKKHTELPQHYDVRVTRAMEDYAKEYNSELQKQRNKFEDENAKLVYQVEDLKALNEGQAMRLKLCLSADIDEYVDRIESLEQERLYTNSTMDELKQGLIDASGSLLGMKNERDEALKANKELLAELKRCRINLYESGFHMNSAPISQLDKIIRENTIEYGELRD